MKAIIITNSYPSDTNLYKNAFVHRRVKNYQENGFSIKIFVISNNNKKKYIYDGVDVTVGDVQDFVNITEQFKPERLLVHFLHRRMTKVLTEFNKKIPTIVWVHGVEALAWYRRLFNFKNKNFLKYVSANVMQMTKLRKFVKENPNVEWVFVSEWMKRTMEKDTFTKVKKYNIIPNVVDTKIFCYRQKEIEQRKNILVIRPFTTKKYATDIVVKSLLELSKTDDFSQFKITIIGDGPNFEKVLRPLRQFENIEIHKKFLNQKEIKNEHDKHGVFLCPTRQDSQGVSMCEAMSSGLVPITSNNTAIPEFVTDKKTGIVIDNDPKVIAKALQFLNKETQYFSELSNNASSSIQEICRPKRVIQKEVELIKKHKLSKNT